MHSCELQAVLVSSDPAVVNSMSESLEKLGITPAVYEETSLAIETLSSQKTDAFLVDRELDPQLSILKAMRHSTSSRYAWDSQFARRNLMRPEPSALLTSLSTNRWLRIA